jgi:hypothetical protein
MDFAIDWDKNLAISTDAKPYGIILCLHDQNCMSLAQKHIQDLEPFVLSSKKWLSDTDLAGRLSRRVQITSDAMLSYLEVVEKGFGSEADYGQLVKTYGVVNLNKDAVSRYSPAEVVKAERTVISGMPGVSRITTRHV